MADWADKDAEELLFKVDINYNAKHHAIVVPLVEYAAWLRKKYVPKARVRKRLDMGDHQSGCRYLNGGPCDCHWTDVMEGRTPYDDN